MRVDTFMYDIYTQNKYEKAKNIYKCTLKTTCLYVYVFIRNYIIIM